MCSARPWPGTGLNRRDSGVLHLDESAMRRKVEETVLPLLDTGHYLPCLDDRPRANTTFSQYTLFRNILEEMAANKSCLFPLFNLDISIIISTMYI